MGKGRVPRRGRIQAKEFGVVHVSMRILYPLPLMQLFRKGQKSYSKQTVYDAHLNSKKHIKAAARQATSETPPKNPNGPQDGVSAAQPSKEQAHRSRIESSARLTYLVTSLLAEILTTLGDTKSNVERRFSLTAKEREAELEEKAAVPVQATANADNVDAAEEEEEERIYNPLKLPLGWDGKPIPYWLYKLHGLGVEYRCEICSDHVYMGRYVPLFLV